MTDFEAVQIALTTRTPLIDDKICIFYGEYGFLSNFYLHPITYEGIIYPSSEHAYQAAKSLDTNERIRMSLLPHPRDAKREGKLLKKRKDIESVKFDIMLNVCTLKFEDPTLAAMLKATEPNKLIEGNHWKDTFWGVCEGKGENNLGQILMFIRNSI